MPLLTTALRIRAITFRRLEVVSFCHSCVYMALLICAFALHNPQPETFILGLAHGLLWIGMSLVCIAAARRASSRSGSRSTSPCWAGWARSRARSGSSSSSAGVGRRRYPRLPLVQ